MAVQQQSVVTPARYEQGITYEQWMEQIDRNQDKFVDNFESHQVDPDAVATIKALMAKPNGPAKMAIIGEPWCPDVFRGLPVMVKLAKACGLDYKIFFRDQNLDMINEFLYKGEFQSIPVAVFYTADHEYIGHWIEKAKKAREEGPLLQAISSKMRNPDLSPEERQKHMAEYADFQRGPVWNGWREAEVEEIRTLLEEKVR